MWNTQTKETMEQPQMWSTHDLACAHCRARKIRCGRERPQCESCKRDGVECRYSSPGKRINHVKLLCQNFEALEDHLSSIQSDLSTLTSLVRSGNGSKSLPTPGEDWLPEDTTARSDETAAVPRKDRNIARDVSQSVDRYHGPSSLYTLCKEFHDDPVFGTSDHDSGDGVAVRVMLQQMLAESSKEQQLDIASDHTGICLPPRQFLNIVVGQFFKGADYATDIFTRSNFQANLDRIYSHPPRPSDEGWAVCFNVIVLLAIGKDQTSHGNSPFIQPFLQTLGMAVNNPRVFLAPRLVNVQALALLSYVTEQYSTMAFAELIFAQACHLARTMGLHQTRASLHDCPPEVIIERQKVFRSLYIRDKNAVVCRGATSCLPGYDSSITRPSEGDEARYSSRIDLARIQDEVYRNLHAAESPDLSPSKHSQLLSQLEHKLEQCDSTHRVTKMPPTSIDSATLMLSFFATRLCILRASEDTKDSYQALRDAKASCLLFLLATTAQPDPRMVEALDRLLGHTRSCSPVILANLDRTRENRSQKRTSTPDEGEILASVLPRLAANFPLAAVFIIARNILQPIASSDDAFGQPEEEILLLEALRDRYASAADQEHVENLPLKLSRTLNSLLRIIRQKVFPEVTSTPSMAFNELSSLQSTASSSSQRGSSRGSLKDTPPDTEVQSTAVSVSEAVSTTSMLLPFMQPLESSSGCSPWLGNASHGTMTLSPWPASYKQHPEAAVHVGKRQRLSNQAEMFDITTGFTDHHVTRAEDDPLFAFDFLAAANDIPVFEVDE
ncbi:Zn(2)-C6 fungal-type domain-containing protein [Fusarium sp. LHS14.1]|nr:Zn(2)-C6 fungal-type domain-containing protein [Fusarium sp. LHS14.1]